ncbi:MAG: helix-turn-helix domain-containing protein [Chloroflexota bacterium]|nr:helix-turn-helix domain-containing protein [Chloroflexota bacterium]
MDGRADEQFNCSSRALGLAREHAGYTQEDEAERVGVSQGTISRWERGKTSPSRGELLRLAQVYGVDLEQLAGHMPIAKLSPEEKEVIAHMRSLPHDEMRRIAAIVRAYTEIVKGGD